MIVMKTVVVTMTATVTETMKVTAVQNDMHASKS